MATLFTFAPLILWLWFVFALAAWAGIFRHPGLPEPKFLLLWLPITLAWIASWLLLSWLWPAPPPGRDGGAP